MKKIVNPCRCIVEKRRYEAYAEMEYENGNLSIHGVVGPMLGGNCMGSAGQCVKEIRTGEPTEEWNKEMLWNFCDIWDKWHLNDMHPYCKHMKELGWIEQTKEKVKVTKWNMTKETRDKIKAAEKRATECLKSGETFIPTPEETMYANVDYDVTTYNDELPEHPEFYEFREKDCLGHSNTEYKSRGWIFYSEHLLGFLGRPCPICGHKYGHGWIKEEVPEEIIEWLFNLPETKRKPAWV